MRWLVALVTIAGCDYVWRIDHLPDGRVVPAAGCPMFPNTNSTDADHDGVGDACDPDPNNESQPDCIRYFSEFAALDKGWTSASSTGEQWTACGDEGGLLCSPRSASFAGLYYEGSIAIQDLELISFVSDMQEVNTAVTAAVEVSAAASPGPSDITGQMCGLGRNASGLPFVEVSDRENGVASSMAVGTSDAPLVNGATIRIDWHPQTGMCVVGTGETTPSSSVTDGQPPVLSGNFVAMHIAHVDINVRWLAIYSKTCP